MDPYGGHMQEPATLHRYLYAGNNPVMMVDPSGEFSFSLSSLSISMGISATLNSMLRYEPGQSVGTIVTNFAIGATEGALFYGVAYTGTKTFLHLLRYANRISATRANQLLLKAFSRISDAGPIIKGTEVPKYFTLTTQQGAKVFVNPNATKHMGKELSKVYKEFYRPAPRTKLGNAMVLSDFEAAVNQAIKAGIKYDKMIIVDGWELIFTLEKSTAPGLVPLVIKHARLLK